MRRMMLALLIHEMIWLSYAGVMFASHEERTAAKLFLLLIFVYLAAVISFVIGKSKRFVLISLGISGFCFSLFLLLACLIV